MEYITGYLKLRHQTKKAVSNRETFVGKGAVPHVLPSRDRWDLYRC